MGGAGGLKANGNTLLVDSPDFPEDFKGIAISHQKTLETIYHGESDLNWTNVSPPAYIFECERTNNFRIGENELLVDEKRISSISMEDFAVAILNEVEKPQFIRKRFTAGY